MLRSATRPVTASRVFAVLLAVHGYAHFLGTADNLRLLDEHEPARLLGGTWTLTNPGLLAGLAVLWAAAGIAFLLTAALVWTANPRTRLTLIGAVGFSLVLCAIGLWPTWIGAAVNLAILGMLRFPNRALPRP